MKSLAVLSVAGILCCLGLSPTAWAAPKSQKTNCPRNLKTVPKSPSSIATFDQWSKLSMEEQREILESGESQRGIAYFDYESLKQVPAGAQRAFANRMRIEALHQMPDQDTGEFDEYVTIGKPKASFQLYVLKDGSIAGGVIRFVQEGSQAEGFEGRRFATVASALKAGVPHPDTTDVSWVWSMTLGGDETVFDNDESNYWQWTGF